MYNKLNGIELESDGKRISLFTDYKSMCNFFNEKDIFRFNNKDIEAESSRKVVINDAFQSVRVPLSNSSYIDMMWYRENPIPNYITVFYAEVPVHLRPQYSYENLRNDIARGRLILPFERSNSLYNVSNDVIELGKETTYPDLLDCLSYHNMEVDTFSPKTIKFSHFAFDGVRCNLVCGFNDRDYLSSVRFYPSYPMNSRCVFSASEDRARFCNDRLLSVFGEASSNRSDPNGEFSVCYDFDTIKVYSYLARTPIDNYPDWSGVRVCFCSSNSNSDKS